MVSITLSIPEKVKREMKEHSEINWSGFVKKCIEEKTKELSWKSKMLNKLKEEDKSGFTDWTIREGQEANEKAFKKIVSQLSEKEKKELGL